MSITKQDVKPKISELYQVGDFIDAKDNQGDWRVGFIVNKSDTEKTFKVRFDGWASKYDEVYRFGHPKLKQFRSIVVGYTGQKQLPALRPTWKFSLEEHQNKLVELHAYVTKNSLDKVKTAHDFNQWIRGHNYFYVDFLMTLTYSSIEQLQRVIEFFKINISFCVKYLKEINENFDKFIQNIQKNNNEHLHDIEVASSWAFYEIFDMIYTISGSYQRLTQFFKDNNDLLRKQFQVIGNRDVKIAYQVKIVEFFYRQGGFQLIDQLLKKIYKLNKSLSFTFLYSVAHLYAGVSCVVQSKSRQIVINQFKLITEKSLEYLGDKQMKDFSQYEVIDLIHQIQAFSKKTSIEQNIQKWAKVIEIQVYFKMITCPYFEKKLRGITSLQDFIEKDVETKKQEEKPDLIADGTLSRWIQQKKLFDVLFSQDNPQLIKKSTELIKYLYHRDNEMQRYIALVWKYRQGKHETALKQIYNFMGDIPIYDKNESFTILLFNQYLSKVDESLLDADFIKMIKDYSVNALNNCTNADDVKETFGFRMIYNYLQKNQNDETLITYLIEILEKLKESKFLEKFIVECFISIEKKVHPRFHISLLLKILKEKLTDLRTIKLDCRSIVQQNIVDSKNSQTENLQEQFQLLNEYLKQAKEIIPDEDFIQFWNQMIDSKGRVQFFKWLYKIRDSGKVVLTNFINLETKQFLLQKFWSDEYLQMHKMDQYEAIFLLQLFKYVNDNEDRIKRTNLVIEVLDQNLTGIQKLHSAYIHSTDPKTTEILAKGLTEIYTCGGESLFEMGINLLQDFIQRIVILVRQYSDSNNIQGVKKMIRLIQQLILRDQEVFDVGQKVRMDSYKNIVVKNLQSKEQKILRFNLLSNVYVIKKIIAEKFNLPSNKFDLIVNDDEIVTYKSYFEPMGQVDKKGKILLKYRSEEASSTKIELNHHLELLFELLGNKAIEERVWNIVSKLPISNQIRQKIMHSENPLEILSNQNSFYKQLYMFKAALSIQNKWWSIDIQQMINFFISRLQATSGKTEIEREYIMVAGKLLENVIKQDDVKDQKLFTRTFLSVFEIMKCLIVRSSEIKNINILYVKKFLETFFIIGEQLNNYLAKNSLISKQPDALSLMLSDPEIQKLFKLGLIEYKHEVIRRQFPVRLAPLTKYNKEKYATRLASIVLDDLLDATVQTENKTLNQFIQFGCFVLQSMDAYLKGFYAQKKSVYFTKLYKLIKAQEPEKSSESINLQLQCYLSMVRCVLKQVSSQELEQFFIYLNTQCLFKGNESKCKSKQTRNSVFNIFIRLIKSNNKVQQFIYGSFSRLHQNGLWRTRRLQDWTITHSERLKSALNYVGLRNLGCICYMNSFFQQIFMIEEFRKSLLLADDPEYTPQTVDDNVLYQVKKMFLNLLYSDKKAYNPKSFCLSFKDYEGNATNVNEQMDIDEFSGILFDRLQNQLKSTKNSSLIKETFGGIYSNEIICKGCPHFSQTEESFLSLSLTVKDKRSIYQSLETMIKGDTLDGDNAYYCQRCDKKVSAVKRVCLKKLPNYLMVALKRFQFDYNTMTKLKLNGYCQFPAQLNLEEYSYEYLRKQENTKEFQDDQKKQKKYYQYKLKGAVIHIGYADSGHYYSLIQQRSGEQRWIEFNDTTVRRFNFENLSDEAFGGETGGIQSKEKIKNAYLLIYERVEKITPADKQTMRQTESFASMNMYTEALQTIKKENFQYNIENILFSAEYIKFIQSLIQQAGKSKQNLSLQKFIIQAFLTVIIRSKTNPDMFDLLRSMYNSFCKGNQQLCTFVLEQFCDAKIYEELFRNCPIRETKRNLAAWACLLMGEVKDDVLRQRFLSLIVSKITRDNENNYEALTILHNLIDEEYCLKFLIASNLIGRMYENIIRRQSRSFGSVDRLQLTTNEEQSFLGYEQVIEKTPFELKKIKYDNESGYVWALVYKIIKRFKSSELASILHPKEVQYLYLTRDKIFKLLEQVKSKFDIDALTNLLCYLSQSNLQFTIMLIQLIEKGLKQFQSKRYRQFFELFAKLIQIKDELLEERITGIFNIMRSLKENEKYAMDCTIIELWICKIVNENQDLRTYLIKEKTILKYLFDLPLKKVPSEQLSKKNINFTQTSVNKFHGIPFPPSHRGYTKLLRHVEHFYEKLLTNEYEPINFFESGNHLVYDKISPGDKIAYFDIKEKVDFEEASVKEIFVDKLLILRKGSNKPFWIWIDDQKLTGNLKVIKDENDHELDSSKTTEMEDEIDFQAVN